MLYSAISVLVWESRLPKSLPLLYLAKLQFFFMALDMSNCRKLQMQRTWEILTNWTSCGEAVINNFLWLQDRAEHAASYTSFSHRPLICSLCSDYRRSLVWKMRSTLNWNWNSSVIVDLRSIEGTENECMFCS